MSEWVGCGRKWLECLGKVRTSWKLHLIPSDGFGILVEGVEDYRNSSSGSEMDRKWLELHRNCLGLQIPQGAGFNTIAYSILKVS